MDFSPLLRISQNGYNYLVLRVNSSFVRLPTAIDILTKLVLCSRHIQFKGYPPILYFTGHIKILIACCRWDDPFVSFPAEKCSSLAIDIRVFLTACRSEEGNESSAWMCPLSCVVGTPKCTILEVHSPRQSDPLRYFVERRTSKLAAKKM